MSADPPLHAAVTNNARWCDQDPSGSYSVKDSFARLDLAPSGLVPLFDAEWILHPAART